MFQSADVDAGHQVAGVDVLVRVEVLLQRVLQAGARVEDEAIGVVAKELLEGRQVQRGAETVVAIQKLSGSGPPRPKSASVNPEPV